MISGATGALAVVMVSLVMTHGAEYLFATVVLMGILQIIAGVLRWGKFIRMVPHPVMLGFVNGLAIVIGLAQLEQFKTTDASGNESWLAGAELTLTLILVAADDGHHLDNTTHHKNHTSAINGYWTCYHCCTGI